MSHTAYAANLYFCNHWVLNIPCRPLRMYYYRRFMGFALGSGSNILMEVRFRCRQQLTIGERSVINERVLIDNRGGVSIGSDVSISMDTQLITADHDLQDPTFGGRVAGITIHNHVFIGARAMILPGVTLNEGSAVAAGSIVTKDVEPYAIVAGTPAKKIGERPRDLSYQLSYYPLFE
ncbi:MAG: acyltransferase [Verrucomicrobiota bacterium]